jgi:hypothetical protein
LISLILIPVNNDIIICSRLFAALDSILSTKQCN